MLYNLKDKLWPDSYEYEQYKQEEAYTWYQGDPSALQRLYLLSEHRLYQDATFWGTKHDNGDTPRVHVDIAGDIAQTSAALLFSEPPAIAVDQEDISTHGSYKEIIDITDLHCVLEEAAEICAASGGVYIKLNGTEDSLYLEAVPPHSVFPIYEGKVLTEVYFYTRIGTDINNQSEQPTAYSVFLREHRYISEEGLVIESDFVRASGNAIVGYDSISDHPGYSYIIPHVVVQRYEHLGVVYVPNLKPNAVNPASPQGRPDYIKCYTMFDFLDETATNWRRDIRLGKSTNFISSSLLEITKSTDSPQETLHKYRHNTENFVAINMEQDMMFLSGGKGWQPMTHIQADIRSKEFIDTYLEVAKDLVRKAGYSPQTFGFETSNYVQTGVSVTKMERRTFQTKQKKQRYWASGIKNLLEAIRLYGQAIGISIPDSPITVDFADGASSSDIQLTSDAVRNFRQVRAMSTYAAIKLQHPSWTDAEIQEEVKLIKKELEGSNDLAGRDMNFNQQTPEQDDGAEEEAQDAE